MPRDGSPAVDAARATVASLVAGRASVFPGRRAVMDDRVHRTYAQLEARVAKVAGVLVRAGLGHGDRIAILSENRTEYLELIVAAARIGAIVACQNWRLAAGELRHCLALAEPRLTFASARHRERLDAMLDVTGDIVEFGEGFEAAVATAPAAELRRDIDPEDPLLILYTSGTTGLPKGAVLSHRAQIVRNLVVRAEFGLAADESFVSWSPMYHMGGTEFALGTLMSGGTVIVVDGFDPARLAGIVESERLGWLLLMPGMVGALADELTRRGTRPRGVTVCGVMADLVAPEDIARITRLLDAPYANTFGATETGCPPCSSSLIPIGEIPRRLSKQQSPYCEVRLVDADEREVPVGTPGELCMRGPTLFSGYWRAPDVDAHDFRGGWFHMGDVFVRNPDGTLDFVDRVKYLIKSGGENIYPAEIERVLQLHPDVRDVAVVRRRDDRWGEVPVAFVARRTEELTADHLRALCREHLAGYKQPKGFRFLEVGEFPRSASGKIQRHLLEKMLEDASEAEQTHA